jgi:hypothetical protein
MRLKVETFIYINDESKQKYLQKLTADAVNNVEYKH